MILQDFPSPQPLRSNSMREQAKFAATKLLGARFFCRQLWLPQPGENERVSGSCRTKGTTRQSPLKNRQLTIVISWHVLRRSRHRTSALHFYFVISLLWMELIVIVVCFGLSFLKLLVYAVSLWCKRVLSSKGINPKSILSRAGPFHCILGVTPSIGTSWFLKTGSNHL